MRIVEFFKYLWRRFYWPPLLEELEEEETELEVRLIVTTAPARVELSTAETIALARTLR